MRSTSGRPLLLGAAIALVLAVGITVAAVDALDSDDDAAPPPTFTADTGPRTRVVPAANQAFVTGIATAAAVEGALPGATLPTPLLVTTPSAGFGAGATIEGAIIDGDSVAIVWDAGRDFDLAGADGGLLLDRVTLQAVAGQTTVQLTDDVTLGFVPGTYQLRTPVAVGGSGLAETVEGVTFEATESTTIAFRGSASTAGPGGVLMLLGPGRVALDGTFEVQRADGTTAATRVELPDGAFELTLMPRSDGSWTVDATLQGEVVSR